MRRSGTIAWCPHRRRELVNGPVRLLSAWATRCSWTRAPRLPGSITVLPAVAFSATRVRKDHHAGERFASTAAEISWEKLTAFSPCRCHRPPPPAAPPARRRSTPPRLVARCSAAMHGLDRRRRRGDGSAAGISRASERPVGKAGGDDFQRHCTARRDESHRGGAPLAYGPTLAWASSNAQRAWRQRAGTMGGGTDASVRGRRIRV